MKKHSGTILLVLIFFVGLAVMVTLHPIARIPFI